MCITEIQKVYIKARIPYSESTPSIQYGVFKNNSRIET